MNAFEEKMWERREGEMIGEKRGRKEGVAQGERTKQREIARKMVEMKMALDIIAKGDRSHRAGVERTKEEELKPE